MDGMAVLDLGCGYGWHCKYAADHGADKVLGIDLSEKMLAEAARRNRGERIWYRHCGIEAYEYPESAWDEVVSNLTLHYIEDLDQVFWNVWRTLRPGGIFLFNIEHPGLTSGTHQDWIYGEDGTPQYWSVDDYYRPGRRRTRFLGCEVIKPHHTLTQILKGLLNCKFTLEVVEEVRPSEEMLEIPGMKDEMRWPMMLLVRAKREAVGTN